MSAAYRGTSLIRKHTLVGTYRSLCLESWEGPRWEGVFYERGTPVRLRVRLVTVPGGRVGLVVRGYG